MFIVLGYKCYDFKYAYKTSVLFSVLKGDFGEHMLSRDFRFSDPEFGGAGSEFDQKQRFELSRARNYQWTMIFTKFRLTLGQRHFLATTGIYYRKGSYPVYVRVRARVRVTLRWAVYRQSVRLEDKSPETKTRIFIFQLNT
jgi:hypothetical protein